MRAIHVLHLDKARPALLLTRETVASRMNKITVAPITSTVRGLSTEVSVGRANGLDHACVISCDNITTVDRSVVGARIGYLLPAQEWALAAAVVAAFDLAAEVGPPPDTEAYRRNPERPEEPWDEAEAWDEP